MGRAKFKASSYERRVLVVSAINDLNERESIIEKSYFISIKSNIDRHIAKLDDIIVPVVPRIKFDWDEHSLGSQRKYEEFLKKGAAHFRVVVNVHSDQFTNNFCHSKMGISHLVEIIPDENRAGGWIPSKSSAGYSVSLVTDLDKLACAIEDICIDVVLCHTWKFLCDEVNNIFSAKKFSENKTEFALKNFNSSFYGPIDIGCKYTSLTSFCRTKDELDYESVYRVWKEFLEEYYSSHSAQIESPEQGEDALYFCERPNCERSSLAPKEQLEFATFKDQLPDKIFKEVSTLPVGKHILARISKNPKRKIKQSLRKEILTYFGGTQFRIGKAKFFRLGKYSKLKKFFPYVQFFMIEVK